MPELPEVETVRAPARAGARRAPLRARRDRRRPADAPDDPAEVAAELDGRARRGARAARQVSGCPVRERSRSPDSPPDDGELLHAPAGEPADDPHRRAVVRSRRRIGRRLPRRPPLRHLAARSSPDELEPYLAARLGGEPLGRAFTATALGARLARPPGAGQGGAPRPAHARRRREHLRRRGALARAHPSAAAGAASSADDEVARAPPRRSARRSRPGIERQGATLRDYRRRTARAARCSTSSRSTAATGEPCDRCGTPIEKTRVAGRGTWYCPTLPAR